MRRQALRLRAMWLVVAWDCDGVIHKTWLTSKRDAEREKEHLLRSRRFESVAHPIGPWKLESAPSSSHDSGSK